jgi:cyclophilin family peptidyl-prolyl cis-trans isomerase
LVAASAVSYDTGKTQHDRLRQMRLSSVSFGEHSDAYPHEKYTVAFGKRGPDFYINALNNTLQHGYGAQKHHDLDDEADPCFAKVVEGKDVVDALNQISIQETKNDKGVKNTWQDHALTRIVRAEIVGWKAPAAIETKKNNQFKGTTEPRSKTPEANEPKTTKPRKKKEIAGRETPQATETAQLAASVNNLQEMRGVV